MLNRRGYPRTALCGPGKAHVSRLSWHLVRGTRRAPASIASATCRERARSHGLCAEHGLS